MLSVMRGTPMMISVYMGVPDFYLSSFWTGVAGNERPFSDCKECEQGLFLKEFRVCTACGLKGS